MAGKELASILSKIAGPLSQISLQSFQSFPVLFVDAIVLSSHVLPTSVAPAPFSYPSSFHGISPTNLPPRAPAVRMPFSFLSPETLYPQQLRSRHAKLGRRMSQVASSVPFYS